MARRDVRNGMLHANMGFDELTPGTATNCGLLLITDATRSFYSPLVDTTGYGILSTTASISVCGPSCIVTTRLFLTPRQVSGPSLQ